MVSCTRGGLQFTTTLYPAAQAKGDPPGAVARTRPLCAHPKVAKYSVSGSTDAAGNFRCEKP
jgi:hypothetical protein